MSDAPKPFRMIEVGPHDAFFWSSGADGRLRFLRCADCGRFHHPAGPVCAHCHGRNLAPEPVSGRATVATFTINHQPFVPGFEMPYVIALVEIDEDPTIRLMTNIVGCAPTEVRIGMAVTVVFEPYDDHLVPLFTPAG
jgi:uncharacterized OB-fold protein